MAVPKRKTSKSKNGMRQAGKGLVRKNNIMFDKDDNPKMFHYVVKAKREKKPKEDKKEDKE